MEWNIVFSAPSATTWIAMFAQRHMHRYGTTREQLGNVAIAARKHAQRNPFAMMRGRPLDSRDLRSGMALIAAGLAADGQSRLSPLETVERGYGRLVERLQGLGAKVAKLP
jgi:UDP-N-acetylglucosamine enolpyruvyl transferase